MGKRTTSTGHSSELSQLSNACANWRKSKKHRFQPIPQDIQLLISRLIKSRSYSNNQIIIAAGITSAKFHEIANKQFDDVPDFIPFTLLANNSSDNKNTQTCQTAPDPRPFASALDNSNQQQQINLKSSQGDSLSIPASLGETAIQNIIKIFLCCK